MFRDKVVGDLFLVIIANIFPTGMNNLKHALFDLLRYLKCLNCGLQKFNWAWLLFLFSADGLIITLFTPFWISSKHTFVLWLRSNLWYFYQLIRKFIIFIPFWITIVIRNCVLSNHGLILHFYIRIFKVFWTTSKSLTTSWSKTWKSEFFISLF